MSVLVAKDRNKRKDSNICICCSNKYTVKRDYCEWKAGAKLWKEGGMQLPEKSRIQIEGCLYYDKEHKLDHILGLK